MVGVETDRPPRVLPALHLRQPQRAVASALRLCPLTNIGETEACHYLLTGARIICKGEPFPLVLERVEARIPSDVSSAVSRKRRAFRTCAFWQEARRVECLTELSLARLPH